MHESFSLPRFHFAVGVGVFVCFLLFYLYAAMVIPSRFTVDGHLNYGATRYLIEEGRLPVVSADDPKLMFSQVGATRSLRPPLTYIASAVGFRATGGWVTDRKFRLRVGLSVLGAATVLLMYLAGVWVTGKIVYGLLAAGLLGFLPRFVIIATTNNDDIGAIFSIAALTVASLVVIRSDKNITPLIMLAAAIGLVLQSKLTAWLCLPWLSAALAPRLWQSRRYILSWSPILLVTTIVFGGWWLLFNMSHYGWHDPLALNHAAEIQNQITGRIPNREGYWAQDVGLLQLLSNHNGFMQQTFASMLGQLSWISMPVTVGILVFYAAVSILGFVGLAILWRSGRYLISVTLGAMLCAQFAFYLHHNWLRDVQPDGRYLLPAVVPLIALAVLAWSKIIDDVCANSNGSRWLSVGVLFFCFGLFIHNLLVNWMPNGVVIGS